VLFFGEHFAGAFLDIVHIYLDRVEVVFGAQLDA
jgi:hypothetical protein